MRPTSRLYVLLPVFLAGVAACSSGGEGSEITLEGIWNADLQYETRNGEPYHASWVMTFRFDPGGEAWSCVLGGVQAEVCTFEGEASTFYARATVVSEYNTYTRTRVTEVQGEDTDGDKVLETSFTFTYHYDYKDPEYQDGSYVYTGSARMVRVERVDAAEGEGLRLLGEYGEFVGAPARMSIAHEAEPGEGRGHNGTTALEASANVRVRGDYAFLARFSDGYRVLDISDPAAIREVAHVPVNDAGGVYYNDVKLFQTGGRDYAVFSDAYVGLVVYDVTDPSQPVFKSTFFPDLEQNGDYLNNHTVFMVGTIAYMGNYDGSQTLDPINGSGGLLIVDLSDPAQPRELGRWLASAAWGTFVHDLYVEDGIAYLCGWEMGLVVLDVREPSSPVVLGRFTYERMTSHSVWVTTVDGRKVAVHGDEDFGSHIRIVDVDPASPEFMTQIGEFELRPEVSVHNIMAQGSEAVAAYYQDGVRVLDLSDVTAPRQVVYYNTWEGPDNPLNGYSFYEGGIGVDVVGDRIYLADIRRGLMILERE